MKRNLLGEILFYITAPRCPRCRRRIDISDDVLCPKCARDYEELKNRSCSICNKKLNECNCSNDYLKRHYVKKVIKVFRYGKSEEFQSGNSLIFSLKDDYRQDVINFLADELVVAIKNSIKTLDKELFIITNIPRRPAAIRKAGYDHAGLLARAVGKRLDIAYIPLLYSRSKRAQKEAISGERFVNVEFEYNVYEDFSLKGKSVLVVDDIITTGASIGKAAMMIKGLRAKEIIAATVAIAYKDSYTPPKKTF